MARRSSIIQRLRAQKARPEDLGRFFCVKDIMREYSLSYQTVNHYTDFGLLPVSLKKGNMRFYDRQIVARRMKAIRELMGEGYPLRLICKKLDGM
ncbi:MAG: hypothetical protein A3D87_01565 [Omnitrophica WOR_2 bacterium RIFCSPHIGHO2_02_FULL_50_17]|nr:MAG: hypothetical protein A3D87_01565 [Omnitrophica WOR_2 bacterium RIFCSPHIGHO2_02_FULL_50_17]